MTLPSHKENLLFSALEDDGSYRYSGPGHSGRSMLDLLNTLLTRLLRFLAACSSFTMQGLELTRRELISPVLILASLLAKSQVELRAEATVQGSLGCWPIDYTALIEQVQILLTEAKKAELKNAEGQVRQTSFVQGLLLNPDTDLERKPISACQVTERIACIYLQC
jgi:hypothetical protein